MTLGYRPGLDGLRGLAVAAVVAYHLGAPGLVGGWLGVSLFFTLSGFLITSLLLGEHAATGRIDLAAFWGRRARRLLPAAAVTLGLAAVVGAVNGGPASLPGDVRAAVAYVANWRFIAAHQGYGAATADPSPVQHLWSLAIEEQFYVVFPLLAAVVAQGARKSVRCRLGLLVAGVAVASLVAQVVVAGTDRRYFGTDTRAAELALGALAAVLAAPLLRPREAAARSRAGGAITAAGALALVATVGLWTSATLRWHLWAQGGFTVVGGLSALVVVAAAVTPLGRLVGAAPLVWLGRRSYGVYLYHWPLLLLLTPERTGRDGLALGAVRVAVTAALAAASYRLLEQPIRQRRHLVSPRRAGAVGVAALSGVLALSLAVPAPLAPIGVRSALAAPPPAPPPAPTAPATATPTSSIGPPPTGRPPASPPAMAPAAPPTPASAPPPVVWLLGDSVPYYLGLALAGREQDLGARVVDLALPSCDGARGPARMRLAVGDPFDEPEGCQRWEETWSAALSTDPPDRIVLLLGATTIVDRRLDGRWRNPCDADFRAWYEPEVVARVDWLAARTAAPITLATTPWADDDARFIAQHRYERTDCVNDVFRAVAAARPAVHLLDLAAWVCPDGPGACRPLRDDGLHYGADHAVEVARFLLS